MRLRRSPLGARQTINFQWVAGRRLETNAAEFMMHAQEVAAMSRSVASGMAVTALVYLSACVDTTAVKNFANESSVITSNAAVMGSDAAFAAAKPYLNSPDMKQKFPDALSSGPGTPQFDGAQKLVGPASKVLQQYMQALAMLAGSTTVFNSTDVSGIASSLKTLGVSGSAATPALNATSQLANLVASGLAQQDIRDVVEKANPEVQIITKFLAVFAQQNANLYDKARVISGAYWQNLVADCEATKSRPPVGCRATIALAIDVHSRDETTLRQQIDAADAAATAFNKIGADHQAIADSAGKFNSAELLQILKADEPALMSAINNLSKL
jgi:hypothetical protein